MGTSSAMRCVSRVTCVSRVLSGMRRRLAATACRVLTLVVTVPTDAPRC